MWLVVNGRVEEAEAILQKMARYNGVKVHGRLLPSATSDNLLRNPEMAGWGETKANGEVLHAETQEPPAYPWYYIFKNRTMLVLTLVSGILW